MQRFGAPPLGLLWSYRADASAIRMGSLSTSLYTYTSLSSSLFSLYFSLILSRSRQQHPKLSIENQFEKLAREASDDVKAMIPKPALAV